MGGVSRKELLSQLSTYEDWKHCITVLCGIPLTLEFVDRRITALNDEQNENTKKLIAHWGEDHYKQTVLWFEKARQELLTQ